MLVEAEVARLDRRLECSDRAERLRLMVDYESLHVIESISHSIESIIDSGAHAIDRRPKRLQFDLELLFELFFELRPEAVELLA